MNNTERIEPAPEAGQNRNPFDKKTSRREFLTSFASGVLTGVFTYRFFADKNGKSQEDIELEDEKELEKFAKEYGADFVLLKAIAISLRKNPNTKGITIHTEKYVIICVLTKDGSFSTRVLENSSDRKTKK